MSFKDVRDLGEHLKLLGFPHVFPLQALAGKNGSLAAFYIVAEILQWLAGLLEPGTILSAGSSPQTEDDRIQLIRSATEFFVTKSAIKLNPRKLYAASAVTAAELQKITRLLIVPTTAANEQQDAGQQEEDNYRSLNQVDIGDKMDDLRRARELSNDLIQRGAALHELLAKELINKDLRMQQANRPMELSSVERTMKNAIAAAQVKLQSCRAQLESGRVELNALNSKLVRKRGELERTKQRLEALQKIRPAHMQEFEECEKELEDLFQKYFLRLHVRDALRVQLEARTKRATPIASPMAQKPNESSSMSFIPEGLIGSDDDEDFDDEPQLNGGGGGGGLPRRRKFGLDADIPDIRDEDLLLRESRGYAEGMRASVAPMSGKRSSASRVRPTTGRSRKPSHDAMRDNVGGERMRERNATSSAAAVTKKRNIRGGGDGNGDGDAEIDSSFGSSDSDLDVGGLVGVGGALSGNADMSVVVDDDDFDLNSMDDLSISKITGELPMRPKTASKPEHHSDEDF